MFVSFFLPCISFMGGNLTGLDIQKYFTSYRIIWLMPALAGIVLMLSIFKVNTDFIRRVAGLSPFGIVLYAMNGLGADVIKAFQIGAWIALVSGLALIFIPSPEKPSTPA